LAEIGDSVGVDRTSQDANRVELLLDSQPSLLGSPDDLRQAAHVLVVDRHGYFLKSHLATSLAFRLATSPALAGTRLVVSVAGASCSIPGERQIQAQSR
jgi:hypothetical protein